MSDKTRAYSDSAVTIIFKGSSMAEVQGHIDDANSLAGELQRAIEQIAKLEAERSTDAILILSLRSEIKMLAAMEPAP